MIDLNMLMLIILAMVLELMQYLVPKLWKIRKVTAYILAPAIAATATWYVFDDFGFTSISFASIAIFRLFNIMRIVEARMHDAYLLRTARRTSLVLITASILLLALDYFITTLLSTERVFVGLSIMQLTGAFIVLLITSYNVYRSRYYKPTSYFSDNELPTVTVAIPARNETTELEECLHSLLASDYPKLEILVLDDCSQEATSELIRSFAHKGVRFLKGESPRKHWLAKNQAYDQLADEASGSVLLFCGVDTRFGSHAIRDLITSFLQQKLLMMSVMPKRTAGQFSASFIQPMRYWWELALPRSVLRRPPVLSTCWLIDRKYFNKLGGMDAVKHAVLPEIYFAREANLKAKYRFIRAGNELDLQTFKTYAEQQETAIRVRYPQVRRRPELVLLITYVNVLFLFGPFVTLIVALILGWTLAAVCAGLASLLLITTHTTIVYVSHPANVLFAIFNLPVATVLELMLGYTSMLQYEFSTVDWKGRNICVPVMHVYPKLPPLEKR